MTKYILVGGYDGKAADGGRAFCHEFVKGLAEPIKILVCLFARASDTWDDKFDQQKEFFAHNLPGMQLDIQMAQVATFSTQVEWADAIYFRGGRTHNLLEALQHTRGWSDHLEGKTVAGSSAGAHMLTRHAYSLNDLHISHGLGLVNVKVLTHYKSNYNAPNIDWDKAYNELGDFGEKLELITLREGEFKVIAQ